MFNNSNKIFNNLNQICQCKLNSYNKLINYLIVYNVLISVNGIIGHLERDYSCLNNVQRHVHCINYRELNLDLMVLLQDQD